MIGETSLISILFLNLMLGVGLLWIVRSDRLSRWIALGTAVSGLLISLYLVFLFDPSVSGFQFVERHPWVETLNINYRVGVDGISVLFLPMSSLLFVGVILASWTRISTMVRLFYTLLLLLEMATLGIFTALDTILFFFFWESTLIPLYFLISLWGMGPNRRYAAVNYTLFMLTGGIPLLFVFVLLAFNHAEVTGGGLSFDLITLLQTPTSLAVQTTVFFLLLIGFAVKTPLFPLHSWLPLVAQEGPTVIAATLTGLKLGAFGLIRFLVPLTPDASQKYVWLLTGLGVIGIIYGAVLALAQTNLRRMLAYSSISHIGFVVLGIASLNIQGIQGATFQLLNFTMIASGIYFLTGFLHSRVGSTDVISLGGAAKSMPLLAAFFFLFGIAAMGIPGTSSFPAELLILISVFKTHMGAAIAALAGLVLGAAYFLKLYRKAFFGQVSNRVVAEAVDLRRHELIVVSVFAVLVIFLGLYPALVLDLIQQSSQDWIGRLTPQR